MSDSLASFAALFRAVLILRGQEPPTSKADSVRATARLLKLNDSSFEKIFELRAKTQHTFNQTWTDRQKLGMPNTRN